MLRHKRSRRVSDRCNTDWRGFDLFDAGESVGGRGIGSPWVRSAHRWWQTTSSSTCRFSSFMSRRVALNCADGGVLTLCPPRRFSISCPLLEWCVSRMQATGRLSAVRPRDTGRLRMPQTREGVSGGSRRDPQFGTRVRTERDDHRAATRLERGVGVADETVVRVNRRYRGDVTAS